MGSYKCTDKRQVLRLATMDSIADDLEGEFYPSSSTDRAPSFRSPSPHSSPSPVSNNTGPKSWKPVGECQFKCCHHCRPSLVDRTWLSLDGIVNDDIPLTAITGYGFHLQKKRPVAPVEVVEHIGLRYPAPVLVGTF